jgi:hypothetical protein
MYAGIFHLGLSVRKESKRDMNVGFFTAQQSLLTG